MSNFDAWLIRMPGIADGSQRDILDIIALNVRTEIAFGLFSDGCTSLFWKTPTHTFLGQNWDVSSPFLLLSSL
jgi:isopenicillin-N N-acyltransferase-like protein